MPAAESSTADREFSITREFDAPRELVWSMFTDPGHLSQWWGPRGFSTTTYSMDFKPGGVWRFVMHGPDGVDYQNTVTYREIDRPRKLAYDHAGTGHEDPVSFTVTITFDEIDGGKRTRMRWHMLFPTAAAKKFVIDEYGADKGLAETVTRLQEHVALKPFVISRTFDAPRELVWKAWTERDRLMKWFGPKGWAMTTANMDFRPGGKFHYRLQMSDKSEMWGRMMYREIDPPKRLVWVNSFSDPAGGLARHFMHETWPMELLTEVTFIEHHGKTTVTVKWSALNPTPSEQETFDTNHDSMRGGWGGTFDQLGGYLARESA